MCISTVVFRNPNNNTHIDWDDYESRHSTGDSKESLRALAVRVHELDSDRCDVGAGTVDGLRGGSESVNLVQDYECDVKVRECSSFTGYVTVCCQLYRGREGEEVLAIVRGARRREREYAG